MAKLSDSTWNVIRAFQKYIKGDDSEVEGLSLSEIRRADEEMGWRDENASFRLAMKNRIQDLIKAEDKAEAKTEQSHTRAWQLVTGILAALLVAVVAAWLV